MNILPELLNNDPELIRKFPGWLHLNKHKFPGKTPDDLAVYYRDNVKHKKSAPRQKDIRRDMSRFLYPTDWTPDQRSRYRVWFYNTRKRQPQLNDRTPAELFQIYNETKLSKLPSTGKRPSNKGTDKYYLRNDTLEKLIKAELDKYWFNPHGIDIWSGEWNRNVFWSNDGLILTDLGNDRNRHYKNGLPFRPMIYFDSTIMAATFRTNLSTPETPHIPPYELSEDLWVSISLLSKKILTQPNWRYYSWKDDWESDLILHMAERVLRFNPFISNNPFSWLTSTATNYLRGSINKINAELTGKESYGIYSTVMDGTSNSINSNFKFNNLSDD